MASCCLSLCGKWTTYCAVGCNIAGRSNRPTYCCCCRSRIFEKWPTKPKIVYYCGCIDRLQVGLYAWCRHSDYWHLFTHTLIHTYTRYCRQVSYNSTVPFPCSTVCAEGAEYFRCSAREEEEGVKTRRVACIKPRTVGSSTEDQRDVEWRGATENLFISIFLRVHVCMSFVFAGPY